MNKNKIILIIVGLFILVFIFILIGLLSNGGENKGNTKSNNSVFNIWILGDESSKLNTVMTEFKLLHPEYKNQNIIVNSFQSYEDYYFALTSAISKDQAPDIFVLNNSEKKSIFDEQVYGIDPTIINPNDFRKKYKGVFSDDLIQTYDVDGETKEYLKGLPVGYETLGVFYNLRYIRASDLENLSSLNIAIKKLKLNKPSLIPFGAGNGSTVVSSEDIITQLFLYEEGVSSLSDLSGGKSKQPLATYFLYGDESGDNGYNEGFSELQSTGKNNINLFSAGETYMVIGYPSLINTIQKSGYSKNFLLASPFPHYFSGAGKTLINYNYFVIDKNTKNIGLANNILQFLSTDTGAKSYFDQYPYYLPSMLTLESDMLERKISPDFNVTLGDFYDPNFDLGTFDKGIKILYDRGMIDILDTPSNYIIEFNNFSSQLLCKVKKFTNLENIGTTCE